MRARREDRIFGKAAADTGREPVSARLFEFREGPAVSFGVIFAIIMVVIGILAVSSMIRGASGRSRRPGAARRAARSQRPEPP